MFLYVGPWAWLKAGPASRRSRRRDILYWSLGRGRAMGDWTLGPPGLAFLGGDCALSASEPCSHRGAKWSQRGACVLHYTDCTTHGLVYDRCTPLSVLHRSQKYLTRYLSFMTSTFCIKYSSSNHITTFLDLTLCFQFVTLYLVACHDTLRHHQPACVCTLSPPGVATEGQFGDEGRERGGMITTDKHADITPLKQPVLQGLKTRFTKHWQWLYPCTLS